MSLRFPLQGEIQEAIDRRLGVVPALLADASGAVECDHFTAAEGGRGG